ncbi:MAG TPA: hypothetical protein VFX55_16345 [Duganella sp.]|nr:hypothetical protein [Duganella sp.]
MTLSSGGTRLQVPANANQFNFPDKLNDGASYNVTIASQPLGFSTFCDLSNGAGVVKSANISNITIACRPASVVVTTLAGSGATASTDGQGLAAGFNRPVAVATDASGNVYVADSQNFMVRKITPAGVVSTLARGISSPQGLVVDSANNVYVGNGIDVRKISATGEVSVVAGGTAIAFADGTGSAARFGGAQGIALDAAGNIYVADYFNHRIRKITPTGVVTTFAGSGQIGFTDGTGTAATFGYPGGLAMGPEGDIYVIEASSKVRKISPASVVSTFVDLGSVPSSPDSVAVDQAGNLYVAFKNEIRLITPKGAMSTLAGKTSQGNENGIGAAASFAYPRGLALDSSGNLYVADTGNQLVRKLSSH